MLMDKADENVRCEEISGLQGVMLCHLFSSSIVWDAGWGNKEEKKESVTSTSGSPQQSSQPQQATTAHSQPQNSQQKVGQMVCLFNSIVISV